MMICSLSNRSGFGNVLAGACLSVGGFSFFAASSAMAVESADSKFAITDTVDAGQMSKSVAKYLQERGDAPLNLEGHRKMASWCEKHGLKEQAKAHWYGVLGVDPNDKTARAKLRFQRVDGKWLSDTEIKDARNVLAQRMADMHRWTPQLRKWVKTLSDPRAEDKLATLREIEAFSEPSAVFALKHTALQLQATSAVPIVEAIKRVRSEEACHALLEIALNDPASLSGQAATEGLRDYQDVMYVPDLIESIAGDTIQSHYVYSRPNGETVVRQIQMQELRDFSRVNVLDTVVESTRAVWMRAPRGTPGSSRIISGSVKNGVAHEVALNTAIGRAERAQAAAKFSVSEQLSKSHAIAVLELCSGEKYGDEPSAWWNWWDRTNEAIRFGPKGYDVQYREDRSQTVYRDEVRLGRACECLMKGTLVRTAFGPKPIESIRIGDLVVSQDIESGELSLKPVLNTTLRPPAKTIRFETEGDAIQATRGHYWWVAGKGWVRTKEMEVGMNLYHATGTRKITRISPVDDEVETYNLVVGDNHTYLVGTEGILSNDATELRPTLQVVPGRPQVAVVAGR